MLQGVSLLVSHVYSATPLKGETDMSIIVVSTKLMSASLEDSWTGVAGMSWGLGPPPAAGT